MREQARRHDLHGTSPSFAPKWARSGFSITVSPAFTVSTVPDSAISVVPSARSTVTVPEITL